MDEIQIAKECANDFLVPAGSVTDSASRGRVAEGDRSVPTRGRTICLSRNLAVRPSIIQWRASPLSGVQPHCLWSLPLSNQSLRLSPTEWNPVSCILNLLLHPWCFRTWTLPITPPQLVRTQPPSVPCSSLLPERKIHLSIRTQGHPC